LFLGAPRDKIGAQEYKIVGGRLTCIRIASPISIRISKQLTRRGVVELKAMMECAFNITQYTFEYLKMISSWSMHILAIGIDIEREIRASNG
jgi:hypothetical protein